MVGKLLLKWLPWWAYVPIIVIMVPLALSTVQEHFTLRAGLDAAKSAPAPKVTPLSEFALEGALDGAVEIAALGQFKGIIGDIEAGKIDFAFALLEPADGSGPTVALVTEGYLFDLLLERIVKAKVEGGVSLIRGFEEKDHRFKSRIERTLKEAGDTRRVYVVEPYWGTRADALDGRLGSNLLLVVISVGFTLIFAFICATKLVRWILRVRAKQGQVRLPDDNPLGQSEHTRQDRMEPKDVQEHSVVRRRR